MPAFFFWRALKVDYATAVRANTERQIFTIMPRDWYIDATFCCARCNTAFLFSREEQRYWYETLKFYVDSTPKHCPRCRHELRKLKALRQEYDRNVADVLRRGCSLERKHRLLAVIDALNDGHLALPERFHENRRVLARQINRLQGGAKRHP